MSALIYNFEWDPVKASSNRAKHGVSFDEAATVFRDARMLSIYDREHSQTEDRWVSLGLSELGRPLVVCHTFREVDVETSVIRIFSARKATKTEVRKYEE
jgi:uncharacterized DUF497 family protein